MKTEQCPSCGAPVAAIKGKQMQTCAFCDTAFEINTAEAAGTNEPDDKLLKKLFRRAHDSEQRGLLEKSRDQYQAIAATLTGEGSDREIKALTKAYTLGLRAYLDHFYNAENGVTLRHFQLEVKPSFRFTGEVFIYKRIDTQVVEIVDRVEDKCEQLKGEASHKLAIDVFEELFEILNDYIPQAASWMILHCGFTYKIETSIEYGTTQTRILLYEPVKIAAELLCEMHSMLARYIDIVELGNYRGEAAAKIKQSYEKLISKGFTPLYHGRTYYLSDISTLPHLGSSTSSSIKEFIGYRERLDEELKPLSEQHELKQEDARAQEEALLALKEESRRRIAEGRNRNLNKKFFETVALWIGVTILIIVLKVAEKNLGKKDSKSHSPLPIPTLQHAGTSLSATEKA